VYKQQTCDSKAMLIRYQLLCAIGQSHCAVERSLFGAAVDQRRVQGWAWG